MLTKTKQCKCNKVRKRKRIKTVMTVCAGRPKESTDLSQSLSKGIGVTGYKVNTQKSTVVLYASNKQLEIEIKTHHYDSLKEHQYLGINLVKDFKIYTLKMQNVAEKN